MRSAPRLAFLGVLLLILLSSAPAHASTMWYVSSTGNNSADCLSALTACRTIQAAINKASVSTTDYIIVAPGIYSASTNGESFPITIHKSIIIHGSGTATTILDAMDNTKNVISAGGNNMGVYIDNFTIQGGSRGIELVGYYPGVMLGIISQNKITGNVIGIYTSLDNQGTIEVNDVSGNTNWGIYNENSSPSILRNVFGWNGNGETSAAIYNENSNPSIANNIMGWNNGSGIFNTASSPSIINNTISFNTTIWLNDGVAESQIGMVVIRS